MKRYLVTSDIHMGDGSKTDVQTPHFDKNLLQELEIIRDLKESLDPSKSIVKAIILGDIWDGLRFDLDACVSAHSEVSAAIANVCELVAGNHDHQIVEKFGAYMRMFEENTYFCHGHEFDAVNSGKLEWVGDTCAKVAGWTEKHAPKIGSWLDQIAGKIQGQGTGRNDDPDRFSGEVLDFIEPWRACYGVICGHTHSQEVTKRGSKTYINTGYYQRDGWTLVTILEPGKYQIEPWKPSQP